jgi:thiol-disulfide isomerase/thioredoxin
MNTITLLGLWLGMLQLPGANLPFHFMLEQRNNSLVLIIQNAEERIVCDEVASSGDSLFVRLPLYDSELRFKASVNTLDGVWINRGRKSPAVIPFHAEKGISHRFHQPEPSSNATAPEGKWETWFDAGQPDSSLAIGLFRRGTGNQVYGTFLTETGDHRYLEGNIQGDSLKLSVFDGSHAWLYLAKINSNSMEGLFFSGNHYKAPFHARRNDTIALRDPAHITRVEGNITFGLPDCDSNIIRETDERFRKKVIIHQVMGTWCPNCMDESVFLDSVYLARKEEGLEVVGFAFERSPDFQKAIPGLRRTINRLGIHYKVVYAGQADKERLKGVFPGLQDFISYPTTIVTNRDGKVVYVHAGFSGPATGQSWNEYRRSFSTLLDKLLR